ncbi:MAG: UDP-N-acetylmuramate--L-alanine ligase [Candidatus Zixiibacteriota bacterium]|nr:MAG: UDP-N-acetylmuramate--L-alanine ligase [candidate division Zixibacteria bacterium]
MELEQTATLEAARFEGRKIMFGRFKRLHFVGIGGAGMSGIAEILANLGYAITGSDCTPSGITEYLESLGVRVNGVHSAEQVEGADVVIISSAVGDDNPEVVEARRLGVPVIKRAEMLGELMRLKFAIGVAGSHGKTTTTSMIGRVLQHAQYDPTLVVGGIVAELGTGAELGSGDYLVAEVDEYDRSIFASFPSMAVVLNIERDHLECYEDMDDLRGAFLAYVNRVPFYGSAIVSADDQNVALILQQITRPYATFGFSAGADYRAVDVKTEVDRSLFSVYYREELLGEIILSVPGRHNVANALAAVAAATELGIAFVTIAEALAGFHGVGRRFEIVGEVNDILVIDDYAHHPTEIEATLKAAKEAYGQRIIAVFQPHLFSRTRDFLQEFATTLAAADWCVLTDIFPAREEPIPGLTSENIKDEAARQGATHFSYVGVKENAVDEVKRRAKPGDMVMTIGAGSITHIRNAILERLKEG